MQAIYIFIKFQDNGKHFLPVSPVRKSGDSKTGVLTTESEGMVNRDFPECQHTVLEMLVYLSCVHITAGYHTAGRVLVLFLPVLMDARQSPNPSTLVSPNAELTVFVQPGSRACHKSQRRHGCTSF